MANWQEIKDKYPSAFELCYEWVEEKMTFVTRLVGAIEGDKKYFFPAQLWWLHKFFASEEVECNLILTEKGYVGFEIFSVLENNGRDEYFFSNKNQKLFDCTIHDREQAEIMMFEAVFSFFNFDASVILERRKAVHEMPSLLS